MEKLLEGMVIEILISFNVKEIWRDGWGVRKKIFDVHSYNTRGFYSNWMLW